MRSANSAVVTSPRLTAATRSLFTLALVNLTQRSLLMAAPTRFATLAKAHVVEPEQVDVVLMESRYRRTAVRVLVGLAISREVFLRDPHQVQSVDAVSGGSHGQRNTFHLGRGRVAAPPERKRATRAPTGSRWCEGPRSPRPRRFPPADNPGCRIHLARVILRARNNAQACRSSVTALMYSASHLSASR